MIHTFQVQWEVEKHHLRFATEYHNIEIKEIAELVKNSFDSMTVKMNMSEYSCWMSLIVDVPLMLERGEVVEEDYDEVENTIRAMLTYVFGDDRMFNDHYLTRMDYRKDRKVSDAEIRRLYTHLYKKTCRKTGRFKKVLGRIGESGDFKEYETSMYHQNKSIQTILYDKEAERYRKEELVEAWEKDVMRFEVRLMKEHLKYKQSNKNHRVQRKIKNYFKRSIYEEYVDKYLNKVYLEGDFYTFEKAREIIHLIEPKVISITMKIRLMLFLKSVGSYDLTVPKNEMNSATFRSRLRILKSINLHPVTIPQSKSNIAIHLPSLLL